MEIKRMLSNQRMSGVVEYNGVLNFAGLVSEKESFEDQLKDILAKFEERLEVAGSDKSRVLSALIILKDMQYFGELNEIWEAWLSGYGTPTRATFKGELARPDILVEIIFTAAVGK